MSSSIGQGQSGDRAKVLAALPRLKIFPLPGAVLLPHGTVPLHIFEPRYRKMTRDCHGSDGVLALAHLAPGPTRAGAQPRVLPIVGVGVLSRVEPLPDGRFNIVLRGAMRARIREELSTSEPYRIVAAEPLLDDPAEATHPAVLRSCEDVRGLILALCAARPDQDAATLAQLAARTSDPGDLADLAAAVLLESPSERQAALEAVRVKHRLDLVSQAAATQLARLVPKAAAARGKLLN